MCTISIMSCNHRVRGGYLLCYVTDIIEKDIVTVNQSIRAGTAH